MKIFKGIVFSCIILLLNNLVLSRTTKFQKVIYKQYNSDIDSHTLLFQTSDTDNLNTDYDGGFSYEGGDFEFWIKRSDSNAEISASSTMRNLQDTAAIYDIYKKFIPLIDGKTVNNKKHYVAYNMAKLSCQTNDPYAFFTVDIKYFDCADEARYFFLKLHNNDSANASYIYDNDTQTFRSNGFITIGLPDSLSIPVKPEEVFMGNGLLHSCAP